MSWWDRPFLRQRLNLFVVLTLATSGVWAWQTMPRREDPDIPYRYGTVTATFPGADADTMERLIVEPFEEALAEVDVIWRVNTYIRADFTISMITLHRWVDEIDDAWNQIAEALEAARQEIPYEAGELVLLRDVMDVESAVLAVVGSDDLAVLSTAAEGLRRELLSLPEVSRVVFYGQPGKQITIEFNDSVARRLSLDARMLAQQLAGRNVTIPSGSIRSGARRVILHPNVEFRSLQEIENTPIILSSGSAVPLGTFATVRRGPGRGSPQVW